MVYAVAPKSGEIWVRAWSSFPYTVISGSLAALLIFVVPPELTGADTTVGLLVWTGAGGGATVGGLLVCAASGRGKVGGFSTGTGAGGSAAGGLLVWTASAGAEVGGRLV